MKYQRKVWHRGDFDWAWLARRQGDSDSFASGSATNRARAIAAAGHAIELQVSRDRARWVTVDA